MNIITKLLREQREEFLKETYHIIKREEPLDCWEAYDEVSKEITEKHTTAQQQLIDVIIENIERERRMFRTWDTSKSPEDDLSKRIAVDEVLQTQITLLEEAKKNL